MRRKNIATPNIIEIELPMGLHCPWKNKYLLVYHVSLPLAWIQETLCQISLCAPKPKPAKISPPPPDFFLPKMQLYRGDCTPWACRAKPPLFDIEQE